MATSFSPCLYPTSSSISSKQPSASSSTVDLKIRRATFQDYEAVVELSKDMYDGIYDYMKTMFFQFLHSKDHHVYVMEYNQQLVGLAMPKTNPEKELLTSMSSRVRPSFAGHGVFKDGGPLPSFVRDHHPSVQHRITCSTWRSGLIYDLNPSTKIFYNWSFYRMKNVALDYLRNRLKMAPASSPSKVKELSYSESVDMLEKDGGQEIQSVLRRYASEFVPIGPNWLPVGINKEGLKRIFSTSTVAATYEAVGPVHTEVIQGSTTNAPMIRPLGYPGKLTAFSYSLSIPGNGNLIASTLFFFGDDVTDLLEHFRFHLRHLANICKDDRVAVALNFPMTIPKDHVIRLIEEFLDDNKGIYTPALCYRSKL